VVNDLLGQVLPEWTALIVNCECGDLLDQLQEIYCAVKQRRFEFTFKIDIRVASARCQWPQILREGGTHGASLSQNLAM
jgi:hypothetical protein